MNIAIRSTTVPLLAAAGTILVWSSAFPAISYGLQAFAPAELALLRFLIASLLFALGDGLGMQVISDPDWDREAAFELGVQTARRLLGGTT